MLTGDTGTRNTLTKPNAVTPTTGEVSFSDGRRLAFPANSVTVLRLTGT